VKNPKDVQPVVAHFTKELTAATAQAATAHVVPASGADTVCVHQSALMPLAPFVPLCLASYHHQIGNP